MISYLPNSPDHSLLLLDPTPHYYHLLPLPGTDRAAHHLARSQTSHHHHTPASPHTRARPLVDYAPDRPPRAQRGRPRPSRAPRTEYHGLDHRRVASFLLLLLQLLLLPPPPPPPPRQTPAAVHTVTAAAATATRGSHTPFPASGGTATRAGFQRPRTLLLLPPPPSPAQHHPQTATASLANTAAPRPSVSRASPSPPPPRR